MNKKIRPINLQLFAENAEPSSNAQAESTKDTAATKDNQGSNVEKEALGDENKEDEVSKLKKQLEEKDKQHQENIKKEVEKALKEEKRLSKLSEEEREKEEKEKRIKELEQRERAIIFKEKLSEVKDELIKRKLPTLFADKLIDEDNQKSLEKINEFEKLFREAVQNEMNSKIKGVNLKTGSSNNTSIGMEMAQKMNGQKSDVKSPWDFK